MIKDMASLHLRRIKQMKKATETTPLTFDKHKSFFASRFHDAAMAQFASGIVVNHNVFRLWLSNLAVSGTKQTFHFIEGNGAFPTSKCPTMTIV